MKLVAISMVAIAASLAASADTKTLSNTAADAVWRRPLARKQYCFSLCPVNSMEV